MAELKLRLDATDLYDPLYVGHLDGGHLCLRLSIKNLVLCCREVRTQVFIPILSPISPVTNLNTCRSFLEECWASFIPRRGLQLAVKGRGGGCGKSSQLSPSSIQSRRSSQSLTEAQAPKAIYASSPGESSQRQTRTPVAPEALPTAYPQTVTQAPAAPISPLDSSQNSIKKNGNPSVQKKAIELAEGVLRLAEKGVAAGMGLRELEDIRLVNIQAAIPIVQKLLQALHQEALWALPTNYMVRCSITRLVRKYLMNRIFVERDAFFASTKEEIKLQLEEVIRLAEKKDNTWPESGTLAQLAIISKLVSHSDNSTSWWQSLFNASGTIFDVYTSKNPLKYVPLASELYSRVSGLVGKKHLIESQILLDTIYEALKEKREWVGRGLADLFEQSKGWKETYSLLVCLEWAFHRNLLTKAHLQLLRPCLVKLTRTSSALLLGQSWRVYEKLGSVLILLSKQDPAAKEMLEKLKARKLNSRVEQVLTYFNSMDVTVEPPVALICNIRPPSFFTGRMEELAQANRVLEEQKEVTLVGPAGIGKTGLAKALASSKLGSFRILWKCDAESPASFLGSLKVLSEELGHKEFELTRLVQVFSEQKALLLIDNMEKELPELKDIRGEAYLILTSRDSLLPRSIRLEGLELSTSVDFVLEQTRRDLERTDVQELCEALSCIPLGLLNMSALLAQSSDSVRGMLASLRNYPDQIEESGGSVNGRLVEVLKRCILQAEAPGVRTLLLIAALSPEGVPKDVYSAVFEKLEESTVFQPACTAAQQYSLLSFNEEGLLTMHRLVQQLVLQTLTNSAPVQQEAAKHILTNFDCRSWTSANKQLYLSAETLLFRITNAESVPIALEVKLSLKVVIYQLDVLGMGQETLPLVIKCEKLVENEELQLDAQDCGFLARSLLRLYQYTHALIWGLQAARLSESTTASSTDKAFAYGNLVSIYKIMGNLEETLQYQLKLVSTSEELLGPKHPDLIISYRDMAMLYKDMGCFDEALQYQLKCMSIREELLGPRHPDLTISYGDMAMLYKDMGQFEEAMQYQLKCTNTREELLGPRHPDLATSYGDMAMLYKDMGQFEEAMQYQLKCISTREEVLGPKHPDLIKSYRDMAMLYHDMGNFEETLKYQHQYMSAIEDAIGKNHPHLATYYGGIATKLQCMGNLKEALQYHLKSLSIKEKVLGKKHRDVASSYKSIASIYKDMGNLEEALEYQLKCMGIKEELLGPEHPDVLSSYKNTSIIYEALGMQQYAEEFKKKALQ